MLIFLLPLFCNAIKIVASPWPPLLQCPLGSSDPTAFTGYYIDLIQKIASELEWAPDSWTLTCMSFDDMLMAIETNSADIAIGCISITNDRLKVMKFSTPTMDSGLVLVTMKNKLSLFWLILQPFDYTMWISIVLLIVVHSHLIWMAEQHPEGPIHMRYSTGIMETLHHSIISLFLLGDLKIRTLSGQVVQIGYWFTGLIIIVSYLSNVSAILSINWLSTNIQTYNDITNATVGGFGEYKEELSLYSTSVVSYNWTYEASISVINDLQNGNIAAAAIPYNFAVYLSQKNCNYLIVGQEFIIDYFAFAFSLSIDESLYKAVTKENMDLYAANYHNNLANKYVYVATTGICDYSADIPLDFTNFGGLWAILLMVSFCGLIAAFIYKRNSKGIDKIFEDQTIIIKHTDLKQAAEVDLQSKFETILKSSEHKFIQLIKDYKAAMQKHSQASTEFKETLMTFAERLQA